MTGEELLERIQMLTDEIHRVKLLVESNMNYQDTDPYLDDDIYLENPNPHPEREMNFLNNSLFLGNNIYLRNSWTDNDWLLITATDEELQIYDSPIDYTQLPIHSIFFQKL